MSDTDPNTRSNGRGGWVWHCPICDAGCMPRNRKWLRWMDTKTGEMHESEVCSDCGPPDIGYDVGYRGGLVQRQRTKKH